MKFNFNWNIKPQWTNELKSSLIHASLGAFTGVVCSFLQSGRIALVLLFLGSWTTGKILQMITKWQPKVAKADGVEKYEMKWWLSNGFYPFFMFWLFCWILFYNIL